MKKLTLFVSYFNHVSFPVRHKLALKTLHKTLNFEFEIIFPHI
jgi:hypothetical protein